MGRRALFLVVGVLVVVVSVACGDGEPSSSPTGTPEEFATLRVPGDYGTIQQAVDAARPGDLILIEPGVYRESVEVRTDNLTIRGVDRNEVILDGEFTEGNGIRVEGADGVAIENMTARNYRANGFFWTGATGYRGSYLTAYRNGAYGIYAFGSVRGQFDHSYASGSPVGGFYIGQCFPCEALMTDVIAEYNGLGYSGTNAGGNLVVTNSVFRFNRVGLMPNSGSYELCFPQRQTTIIGNTVHSNSQPDTPARSFVIQAIGNGILVSGGIDNVIERNLVYDHDKTGIGLIPFREVNASSGPPPDEELSEPCADAAEYQSPGATRIPVVLWPPKGNRVVGNVVEDSRLADLAVGSFDGDVSTFGNCFADNVYTTTAPRSVERLAPCEGSGSGDWSDGALDLAAWESEEHPPTADYRTTPVPPSQPNMPEATTAPPRPAVDVPMAVDLDAISVPSMPED